MTTTKTVITLAAKGLRLTWAVAQLLLAATTLLVDLAWEYRAEIRQALVAAIAALVAAAQITYEAGCWTRRQIEALSNRSAALLPEQPLPAVAPITATVQAAREALEQLVRRLYPVAAA